MLRALAVTTATRSDALPDIPTVAEFVPGYEASAWFGIGAPRNTPAEIDRQAQQGDQRRASPIPRSKARLADLGGVALTGSPADFGKAHRRRNREVGQGGQVFRRQGGVNYVAQAAQVVTACRINWQIVSVTDGSSHRAIANEVCRFFAIRVSTIERSMPWAMNPSSVTPITPRIGAKVAGVTLAKPLSNRQVEELHQALAEHQVLFFRDQPLDVEAHKRFGRYFGELHIHPSTPGPEGHPEILPIHADANSKRINGEYWHSDVSCDEEPPMGSILYLHTVPPAAEIRSSPASMRPMMRFHRV